MDKKAVKTAFAKTFINRADNLGLKGKKRDNAAVEFYAGGAAALDAAGVTAGDNILLMAAVLLVATRGYRGVEEMAYASEMAAERAKAAEALKGVGKEIA